MAHNPATAIFIANNQPSDEKCPMCKDCLEKDYHFIKYGVCGCIIWGKWNDAVTEEALEQYIKNNYKPLN